MQRAINTLESAGYNTHDIITALRDGWSLNLSLLPSATSANKNMTDWHTFAICTWPRDYSDDVLSITDALDTQTHTHRHTLIVLQYCASPIHNSKM